ncbi:hypothetical protein LXL04_036465 [Taraxacum kok-saghyz]
MDSIIWAFMGWTFSRFKTSRELRSFENSCIPENPRTPKPLTFSKNRLRGAKNRSNISPVAKKNFRKNDFFFFQKLCICANFFFVHMSLYNTYLKRFVKKNLKTNAKKKSCTYAQKIKKSCTYTKVKKKYSFFGNFFQRIVMIKNVLEGSEVGFLKGITDILCTTSIVWWKLKSQAVLTTAHEKGPEVLDFETIRNIGAMISKERERERELRSFENSYIPENPRTPKPLTFSKNRLRGAKNRSKTSPVAKKIPKKTIFFLNFCICATYFFIFCIRATFFFCVFFKNNFKKPFKYVFVRFRNKTKKRAHVQFFFTYAKFLKKKFMLVQVRTIIKFENGGTNLDRYKSHLGSFENSYIPENPRTSSISYISQTVIPFKKSTSGPSKTRHILPPGDPQVIFRAFAEEKRKSNQFQSSNQGLILDLRPPIITRHSPIAFFTSWCTLSHGGANRDLEFWNGGANRAGRDRERAGRERRSSGDVSSTDGFREEA